MKIIPMKKKYPWKKPEKEPHWTTKLIPNPGQEPILPIQTKILSEPTTICVEKSKPLRKTIQKQSKKRRKENKEYLKEAELFLKNNPKCAAWKCRNASEQVHHVKGRAGKLFLDKNWWMPVCATHHHMIEFTHKLEARKAGYIIYGPNGK